MRSNKNTVKKHTKRNFREIISSVQCGCLKCANIFKPSCIVEWAEHSSTAVCPYCEEQSVIGSASGFPITIEFLQQISDQISSLSEESSSKQKSKEYTSSYALSPVLNKSEECQSLNGKK